MHTRFASLCLAAFVPFAAPALADDAAAEVSQSISPAGRSIGVGIELGAPTSINAKFMLAPSHAIVAGIGGGIWYDASLSLHGDYLWHPLVSYFDGGNVHAFVGVGAWTSVGFGGSRYGYYRPYFDDRGVPFAFGGRVPLGGAVAFDEVPVEIFAELVPAVSVFPGFGIFGQGGIGARFYF